MVGYGEINAEKLKSDISSNPKLTINIEENQKEIGFQKHDCIVECISLSDIDWFGTYSELSDEEYKIVKEEGFELRHIYEDGRHLYVKKD